MPETDKTGRVDSVGAAAKFAHRSEQQRAVRRLEDRFGREVMISILDFVRLPSDADVSDEAEMLSEAIAKRIDDKSMSFEKGFAALLVASSMRTRFITEGKVL
ncbi:MAG TPA: hypothetical protein VMR77_02115 [Patescibacteria group bacterium]|nr:hypothetical protein [Patescibacteria group bacterium]